MNTTVPILSSPIFDWEDIHHPVRIIGTPDSPLINGPDACAILHLSNPWSTLALIDEDEKGLHTVETLGGPQEMIFLTEAGFYTLIFKSRKPQAKAFRKWITGEVIPSLRRTGTYTVPGAAPAGAGDFQQTLQAFQQTLQAFQQTLQTFTTEMRQQGVHSMDTSPPPAPKKRRLPAPAADAYAGLTPDMKALTLLVLRRNTPQHGLQWSMRLDRILELCDSAGLFQEMMDPEDPGYRSPHGRLSSLGYHLRRAWHGRSFPHPDLPGLSCTIAPRPGARHSIFQIIKSPSI